MKNCNDGIETLLRYQKDYGKRGSDAWSNWILRKRAINTAFMVTKSVAGLDFSDFEFGLYFRCDDANLKTFVRAYEGQMEEGAIHPEGFVRGLHAFYMKMCMQVEENHLFREFFDFCALLEQRRRAKIQQGHRRIFDAYMCLLMQQTCYFCRDRMEDSVSGITSGGDLIFRKTPHPFSDLGCYDLERHYKAYPSGKEGFTEKQLYQAYRPYGYKIHSMEEVGALEAKAKTYDNNSYIMIPYIEENMLDVLVQTPYRHFVPDYPRQWKSTEVYREKLLWRNYMLPVAGITARFVNAGEIEEILFKERLYKEEIVLLYLVSTQRNGQHAGYYRTKSQEFYSIFEYSNHPEWHGRIENFILENYLILSCDYEIDRKKNYAIRQVDALEGEFHYPDQPLVTYDYGKIHRIPDKGIQRSRKYVKAEYLEEVRTRSGYIRRLPVNQKASSEAARYAAKLGIALTEGKTFVRAHEFRIHRKTTSIDE